MYELSLLLSRGLLPRTGLWLVRSEPRTVGTEFGCRLVPDPDPDQGPDPGPEPVLLSGLLLQFHWKEHLRMDVF